MVAHAERGAGGVQLADPVGPELILGVGAEVGERGRDDLAPLTERAGDQGDLHAFGGVPGHGGSGADRFVVGMGVHQQQPPVRG